MQPHRIACSVRATHDFVYSFFRRWRRLPSTGGRGCLDLRGVSRRVLRNRHTAEAPNEHPFAAAGGGGKRPCAQRAVGEGDRPRTAHAHALPHIAATHCCAYFHGRMRRNSSRPRRLARARSAHGGGDPTDSAGRGRRRVLRVPPHAPRQARAMRCSSVVSVVEEEVGSRAAAVGCPRWEHDAARRRRSLAAMATAILAWNFAAVLCGGQRTRRPCRCSNSCSGAVCGAALRRPSIAPLAAVPCGSEGCAAAIDE